MTKVRSGTRNIQTLSQSPTSQDGSQDQHRPRPQPRHPRRSQRAAGRWLRGQGSLL